MKLKNKNIFSYDFCFVFELFKDLLTYFAYNVLSACMPACQKSFLEEQGVCLATEPLQPQFMHFFTFSALSHVKWHLNTLLKHPLSRDSYYIFIILSLKQN